MTERPLPSLSREVVIKNEKGLHARASASVAKLAASYRAALRVSRQDGKAETADGDSIMSLMMLQAGPGTRLIVEASGEERREALEALVSLIERRFDEEEAVSSRLSSRQGS